MNRIIWEGIPCFTGSCSEIYLEKAFMESGFQQEERLPVARELGETSLMFLVHPGLSPEDMSAMADVVEQVVNEATIKDKPFSQ
jgi:dTDP-4-amino-4,6-dideoxygalactose transaminase